MQHCIIRTVQMKYLNFEIKRGTDPYLSKPDEKEFITILIDNANDLSCVSTFMAIKLAHNIKKRRYKRAISLLIILKCERLIHYVDDSSSPSKQWLINLAYQNNLQK